MSEETRDSDRRQGPEIVAGSEFAGHTVIAELGRGGMGVVYRVHDPALDRERALKVIVPGLSADQGFRERFRRESRLAAAVEHPNVIPIDGKDGLRGGDGDDALVGGDGVDTILAGDGEDRITPTDDADPDLYVGGDGIDTVHYSAYQTRLNVSADDAPNDGANCPQQCEDDNVASSVDDITGPNYDGTRLTGGPTDNVLVGGYGDDWLDGAGGNDILRGNDGNDVLLGGAGTDALFGGWGADWLDGGDGSDECPGDNDVDGSSGCEVQFEIP